MAYDFQTALKEFIDGCNARLDAFYNDPRNKIEGWTTKIELTEGSRYIRMENVKLVDGVNGVAVASRSCCGFIDKQTGNILKSASWKAPAKGVRGTLADVPKALMRFSVFGGVM